MFHPEEVVIANGKLGKVSYICMCNQCEKLEEKDRVIVFRENGSESDQLIRFEDVRRIATSLDEEI